MSKFTALPTDNSKTGPSADSIFYRPQNILSDQYKNERIEQQRKQQALLSNVIAPPHRTRPKLQPVTRIAVGGASRNRNRNGNQTSSTTLVANKPANQTEALRAYKKKYSRRNFEAFDKSKLAKGTDVCSLFHRPLHYNRAYVAHFVGSKGPKFSRAKLESIREPDLQTKLEQIQYDKSLNAKRRDELIAKLKFGLEDDEERVSTHHTGLDRPHWFRFEPKVDEETTAATDAKDKAEQSQQSQQQQPQSRAWLGKPKQEDKNYCYVVMEWQPDSKQGWVYPAKFIEFGLATQLKADADTSAESVEKRHRKHLEKWRKKQAEKSMMEKLGNLFGHDQNDGGNHNHKKQQKKKSRSTDELDAAAKEQLKTEYMEQAEIDEEEVAMLRDLMGVEYYDRFMAEHREYHAEQKTAATRALRTGDDDRPDSLIGGAKVLSKRLRANKTRGALEENCDHDEFMSDDEDENNLNDYDVVDDHEEDVLSDADGGDNESDQDEAFQKLEKNLDEDLTKKDYELPEKALKDELENDSDVEEQGNDENMWNISDDDSDGEGGGGGADDDDDDDSGGVTIKRKHKHGGSGSSSKTQDANGDSVKEGSSEEQKTSRKRKVQFDDKNGQKTKKRKLNASEEKKLKEELIELVSKILKKNPDGLDVQTLWNKIVATVSAEKEIVRRLLPSVIQKTAKTKSKMLFPKK